MFSFSCEHYNFDNFHIQFKCRQDLDAFLCGKKPSPHLIEQYEKIIFCILVLMYDHKGVNRAQEAPVDHVT